MINIVQLFYAVTDILIEIPNNFASLLKKSQHNYSV